MTTFQETNPRGTFFSVVALGEALPPVFVNAASNASGARAFRLAGGCSGMSDEQREAVVPYFVEALKGYDGVSISGGTSSGDGKLMVTNVPSALVKAGNPCVALGTIPRTADMAIPKDGSVSVSEYDDRVDTDQHAVAVLQKNASEVLDWDGDLEAYLDYLENLRRDAGYAVAVIAFNGGGVTKKEIEGALRRSIPVIVVVESGRAADEFASQYNGEEGTFDAGLIEKAKKQGLVSFARFSEPESLTQAARKINLL